jgi:adenylate cyclase
MDEIVPAIESLQSYVWRRHTLGVGARLLHSALRESDAGEGDADGADSVVASEVDDDATTMGVGFADIVNYTQQSRSLSRSELTHLIDEFESRALEIVSEHGGRIIKTIGDEILFVADDAAGIARIGLELIEEPERKGDFPELRVGLAWGPALSRLGDVLGPVVNIASRLTSTSRPGRVLVDKALADELDGDDSFKLRRLRRTSVRGYRRLEPWGLQRATDKGGQ